MFPVCNKLYSSFSVDVEMQKLRRKFRVYGLEFLFFLGYLLLRSQIRPIKWIEYRLWGGYAVVYLLSVHTSTLIYL